MNLNVNDKQHVNPTSRSRTVYLPILACRLGYHPPVTMYAHQSRLLDVADVAEMYFLAHLLMSRSALTVKISIIGLCRNQGVSIYVLDLVQAAGKRDMLESTQAFQFIESASAIAISARSSCG
jgi:hypothetical protein